MKEMMEEVLKKTRNDEAEKKVKEATSLKDAAEEAIKGALKNLKDEANARGGHEDKLWELVHNMNSGPGQGNNTMCQTCLAQCGGSGGGGGSSRCSQLHLQIL